MNCQKKSFKHVQQAYAAINEAVPQLKIILQTYFEKVDNYEEVVALPVHGFGLDFVHGDSLAIATKIWIP